MVGVHTLMPRSLWQSESALRCRRCGLAIRLSDRFGLSERVCTACVADERRRHMPPLRDVA
jgi:hypothetical protein